ncbi:phosphatase PAP2 family protein [Nocardioides nanhaiensis]|uniref:Phosphatidic acid phosphatase type 2/haloperoxidase domain-containing protein n=1 Tax=Nocardioides nanhaiensis TaxID=1476871 RepID=A0ABP8VS04_9ACTN
MRAGPLDVVAGLRAAVVTLLAVGAVSLLLGQVAAALQGPVDDPFFAAMEARGTSAWTDLLAVTTQMGNVPETQVLTVVLAVGLAAWFALRGGCWWMPLLVLPLAWCVTRCAQLGLAGVTDREREVLSLIGTEIGAYPSGGVARIVVVTGTAVVLVAHYLRPRRAVVRLLGVGVVLLGVAEMYFRARLNQHWLTDVVAGFVVGCLVLWSVRRTLRAFHPLAVADPAAALVGAPAVEAPAVPEVASAS